EDSGTIRVVNLNGSDEHDLFTGENTPQAVAIDAAAGKIYWTTFNGGVIRVGNLDGSGSASNLFTGQFANGIAIDPNAGKIYWTTADDQGAIRVGNLDGTGAHNLYTGLVQPNYLALLLGPNGTGAPSISGGGQPGQQLHCSQGSWAPDLVGAFLYRAPQD